MKNILLLFFLVFLIQIISVTAQVSSMDKVYAQRMEFSSAFLYLKPVQPQPMAIVDDTVKKRFKIIPLLNFDTYNSFVADKQAKINGIKIGVELNNRFRFGLSGHKLDKATRLKPRILENDTLHATLNFKYSTLFFEYVLIKNIRWDVSIPLSFGIGFGHVEIYSSALKKMTYKQNVSTSIISIGTEFDYRIIPWFGVGGGVGYNQLITSYEGLRDKLSSPIYLFKLKVYLGYLYKAIFRRKILLKEKEEYKKQQEERRRARKEKKEEKKQKPM